MARRTSKKKSQTNLIPIIIGALVAMTLTGAAYFYLNSGDSFKQYNQLPLDTFINNPDSMRGSQYSFTGTVLTNRSHDESSESIYTVEVEKGQPPIAIKIPNSNKTININMQAEYIFNGIVKPHGVFEITEYKAK